MPLNETPQNATNIIVFSGQAGEAAHLDYNVPLPGRVRGKRILKLEGLPIGDGDWSQAAKDAGIDTSQVGRLAVDEPKARELFINMARANGIRGDVVNGFARLAPDRLSGAGDTTFRKMIKGQEGTGREPVTSDQPPIIRLPGLDELRNIYGNYLLGFQQGYFIVPTADPTGGPSSTTHPIPQTPQLSQPALFLVEVYAISSFLGNYGLGRTVKTFTLLPGEQMTIRLRTWRATERNRTEASSIFDSLSQESSDRFHTDVQNETVDRATQANKTDWNVEANVQASWGWGSATVSGGASGENQSAQEQFTRGVTDAAREHAANASSKRDTTVSSSAESSEKNENEEVTERVIRNVNLRRTLNFVFRELNQEYLTKVHLVDLRLAVCNGRPGSWREVPVSGMRGLLGSVLTTQARADTVAQALLNQMMFVFDKSDVGVQVLQTEQLAADGSSWTFQDPVRVSGQYPAPTADLVYRFRRGPLGQTGDPPPALSEAHTHAEVVANEMAARHAPLLVPGVVLQEEVVVLRTDAVIVEALLGQADALDDYAMLSQKADAEAKALANVRAELVNQGLQGIPAGGDRVSAYADILKTEAAFKVELKQS